MSVSRYWHTFRINSSWLEPRLGRSSWQPTSCIWAPASSCLAPTTSTPLLPEVLSPLLLCTAQLLPPRQAAQDFFASHTGICSKQRPYQSCLFAASGKLKWGDVQKRTMTEPLLLFAICCSELMGNVAAPQVLLKVVGNQDLGSFSVLEDRQFLFLSCPHTKSVFLQLRGRKACSFSQLVMLPPAFYLPSLFSAQGFSVKVILEF